jgi:hypothetical protein
MFVMSSVEIPRRLGLTPVLALADLGRGDAVQVVAVDEVAGADGLLEVVEEVRAVLGLRVLQVVPRPVIESTLSAR